MLKNNLEIISKYLFNLRYYKLANLFNKFLGNIFDEKKDLYYKYKFYYRKNKVYAENFLKNIYPPKIFLIKNVIFNQNIYKKIKNYKKNNQTNKYDKAGHQNIYQSFHNLNDLKDFFDIRDLIKFTVQQKIIPLYETDNASVAIEKLWFTITKKNGKMKKHHHLDGDLSGVFYLKCDNNLNSGFINLYSYEKNFTLYEASDLSLDFTKKNLNEKIFNYKPEVGDLIVFDSYVDHSVDNSDEIQDERISMPFDISIIFRS
jgi:uncharacterized protein (TIGR02466 family)|tara:strand:+ start:10189 stop:10965 length:777 start_codon:yes stop_codon:yes gene_type:complete